MRDIEPAVCRTVHEVIGGGVVGDLDHPFGHHPYGQERAGAVILRDSRLVAVELVSNLDIVIPRQRAVADSVDDRVEHPEFECAADRCLLVCSNRRSEVASKAAWVSVDPWTSCTMQGASSTSWSKPGVSASKLIDYRKFVSKFVS